VSYSAGQALVAGWSFFSFFTSLSDIKSSWKRLYLDRALVIQVPYVLEVLAPTGTTDGADLATHDGLDAVVEAWKVESK
jgi:hypothetical protein